MSTAHGENGKLILKTKNKKTLLANEIFKIIREGRP